MDYRHIQFCINQSKVNLYQLQELFNVAAFWAKNRPIDKLEMALAHSNPIVTVWDHAKMIGFARATSDGVYRATIWDVIIHPDYQRTGLGRKLVETVLSHPHISQVEKVYLMTTDQQKFYEKIGFEENQSTTMVIHNNEMPLVIHQASGMIQEEVKSGSV